MPHHAWMSDDQKEFLESRKTEFLAANLNKTAGKDFFPSVFKDFHKKWPVPQVMQGDIEVAEGSIKLAKILKREKYDKV